MEKRKRASALENYVEHLTNTPEKIKRVHEFNVNLRNFYKKKWNAPMRAPFVQGMEIDLFKLYDTVMALGGWQKVSQQERWPDVAEMLGVEDDCLNGDFAVKLLYMRYLSKYEQNETVGDVDEILDPEFSRAGRGRQISFFATNDCPVSMLGRRDHFEKSNGEPDYGRLAKALLSGLPNEVDFAVNICSLLSHPGPRLLRVALAPHIITLLVAHCGIFDQFDEDLKSVYTEVWEKATNRDFHTFWAASGLSKDELELFVPDALKYKVVDDFDLFTGLKHDFHPKDPVCWRIQQIGTIIRNLSFEPINRVAMANHWPLFKFLLACAGSHHVPLYTNALDTLSNLSCDTDLNWNKLQFCSNSFLLKIIEEGIMDDDKFKVIRCMELLGGLASSEGNEAVLVEFLSLKLLHRLIDLIGVKDIMMCVYTLECLYQLSEMGPGACEKLAEIGHAIQTMVSMATIEAVSFGKDGLVGMKVVEYHTPGAPPAAHAQAHQHGAAVVQQQTPMPQNAQPQPQRYVAVSQHGTPATRMIVQQHQHVAAQQPIVQPQRFAPHVPTGNFGCDMNIERLTFHWIRQNCVYQPGAWTARGELYAAYVDDLRNFHHSLSASLNSFSHIMQSNFPDVQFKMAESTQTPLMAALGVRLIKPHKLVTQQGSQVVVQVPPSQASQHIAAPPPPHTVASSHPLMQQILAGPSGPVTNGVATNGEASRNASVSAESSRSQTPDEIHHRPVSNQVAVPVEARDVVDDESRHEARIVKVENTRPAARRPSAGVSPSPSVVSNPNADLMCEWDGCGRVFVQTSHVVHHISSDHLKEGEQSVCKWPGCDATQRNKWSLVTHLMDHHVTDQLLRLSAQKRREGLLPRKPPRYRTDIQRDVPPHPGYSRNAAIEAIRRHAFTFLPRDITDEPEGPVTRSIRLTACLILRNLARYSSEGRHRIRLHERLLCWLALSRLEGAVALSQLLSELHPLPTEAEKEEIEPPRSQETVSSGSAATPAPASVAS